MPAAAAARKAAVASALTAALTDPINDGKETIAVGSDFSLLQVDPANPDLWVVHGDDANVFVEEKGGPGFFRRDRSEHES